MIAGNTSGTGLEAIRLGPPASVWLETGDPARRLGELLDAEQPHFAALVAELLRQVPWGARGAVRLLARQWAQSRFALPRACLAECTWLAARVPGLSPAELALMQSQYGLVAMLRGLLPGCAVSAHWDATTPGWRFIRNLDWGSGPLHAAFARATCRQYWRWADGTLAAEVIGFAGMLGVVTARRFDAAGQPSWAVALNACPWRGWAWRPGTEPTLLLRELLESRAEEDFSRAAAWLAAARLRHPCLVTLVGRAADEALAFDYPPGAAPFLRRAEDGVLITTNQWAAGAPAARHNPWPRPDDAESDDLLRTSRSRDAELRAAAAGADATRGARLLAAHLRPPVCNPRTVHVVDWHSGAGPALGIWRAAVADSPASPAVR